MTTRLRSARRRQTALAACIPVLLVVGLAARFALPDAPADFLGGACYTALVYLLLALIAPRRPPAVIGAWALGFSVAVELFQLTGIPADLADWWPPIRLALGTEFVATDFLAYAVGAVVAVVVDSLVARRSATA